MGFGSGFGVNFTASTRFSGGGGTDRLNGPYANYDAALTALRSKSLAQDGDAYVLSSGQLFAAYVSEGPGILIPADLYPQIDAYVSNATGIAHQTTTDTQADLIARGWTTTTTGAGTITGGDGSAFRLNTVTGSSTSAEIQFVSSTNTPRVLMLTKIQPIVGTTLSASRHRIFSGARYLQMSSTDGVLGQFDTYDFGSNARVVGTIGQFTDTTAQWYLLVYNEDSTNNIAYWVRLDGPPEERVSVQIGALPGNALLVLSHAAARGSVGSQCSFDVCETHALEMI